MNDSVNDSTNLNDAATGNESSQCIDHYEHYASTEKWLLGVVALPFILVGLMANMMSILIFSHRNMRQQRVNW